MNSNFAPRLLGVLAVHGVMGLFFWLFVRFGVAKQDSLAPVLLDRLDGDPARIQTYVDDIAGQVLVAGLAGLAVTAVLAMLWVWTIERNPPYGDASARGKRGPWAGLLILALVVVAGVFWFLLFGNPISQLIAASIGVNSLIVTLVLAVIGYWSSTAAFVPASTKVAVPFASAIFGR